MFWDMNVVPAVPDERMFRIGVTQLVTGVLFKGKVCGRHKKGYS